MRIVTASWGKTARIWDAVSAREIAVLPGRDVGLVDSVAFSPDGSRIVMALGYTALIWDAATAREIAGLREDDNFISSAAFSPDGSRIVTASKHGVARLWDVHLQTMSVKDLIAEVCARLPGLTRLTREEMRLAAYPDDMPEIDVCR